MSNEIGHNTKNSNGLKILLTVAALIALIAGVYAMVEPMKQTTEFQREELAELRGFIREHIAVEGHAGALQRHGRHAEKFTEIETQFSDQERRIAICEKWQRRWEIDLAPILYTHQEKIARLEEENK